MVLSQCFTYVSFKMPILKLETKEFRITTKLTADQIRHIVGQIVGGGVGLKVKYLPNI